MTEIIQNNLNGGLKTKKDINETNHPARYGGDTPYECIKVLAAWLSPDEYRGFLRGNAIKYICRLGKKDEAQQEIKKAQWYLEELKKTYENNQQEAE